MTKKRILNTDELKRLVKSVDSDWEVGLYLLKYILKNNLVANMSDPHPSTQGHIEWAKQLKEFIDANNLRTI
jgi:hypothetical protein